MSLEETTDDLDDGGSGDEVWGGGGRGGASSASGHQGSVPRGNPKERSPWGRGGEGRGGREASVSPGVTPRSGAPGEGEGRGGEEGEATVDVEEILFEAKDVFHKIPKSLVWNYMRYVITN